MMANECPSRQPSRKIILGQAGYWLKEDHGDNIKEAFPGMGSRIIWFLRSVSLVWFDEWERQGKPARQIDHPESSFVSRQFPHFPSERRRRVSNCLDCLAC